MDWFVSIRVCVLAVVAEWYAADESEEFGAFVCGLLSAGTADGGFVCCAVAGAVGDFPATEDAPSW